MGGVVIRGVWVVIEIEAGESFGTFAMFTACRVRLAQKVEIEVAFALVEPVVPTLIFIDDLGNWLEFADLPRDGFPLTY